MEQNQLEFLENIKKESHGDPLKTITQLYSSQITSIYRKDLYTTGLDFKLIIDKDSIWRTGTLPTKEQINKTTYFKGYNLQFDKNRDEFRIEPSDFGQNRADLENSIRDLETKADKLQAQIQSYRFEFEIKNDEIANQFQEELKKIQIILKNYYAKRDMMENGI